MSETSRTGLVPSPKKIRKFVAKKSNNYNLPQHFEALPMALSLRPFGGLFNPFAKTCSVLCNHPAPAEVKQIINQCKQSLSVEGKNIQEIYAVPDKNPASGDDIADNIPEDLFRRYTDTNSRPLTPTPTVTSIHTRTSTGSFYNNRRCITPELGKNDKIKRKRIILDLRRSHSQETLYWKPPSDLTNGGGGFEDNSFKVHSAGTIEEKKVRKLKSEDQQKPKSSMVTTTIAEEIEGLEGCNKVLHTCINEHDFPDENIRRGKRRKKIKDVAVTATTFHLRQDPETQIATLGPDSHNPSTRPSLIPNAINLLPSKEKRESEQVLLKGSFLTDEAFQILKIKVDTNLIENTFDRYLNRAYREVYKYLPLKPREDNDVSKELEKLNMICEKMPRKFSKSAARFNVPMDLQSVEDLSCPDMSVFHYLSNYVWVSRQRKQIYKRIFLKYLNNSVEVEHKNQKQELPNGIELSFPLSDYRERFMNVDHLYQALEDVLEFYGTENNIKRVLDLLNYEKLKEENLLINFRSWCGIVAFAERLALDDPMCSDSCDELEKADFNSMELRLHSFKIPECLKQVFNIIRIAHNKF